MKTERIHTYFWPEKGVRRCQVRVDVFSPIWSGCHYEPCDLGHPDLTGKPYDKPAAYDLGEPCGDYDCCGHGLDARRALALYQLGRQHNPFAKEYEVDFS